MNFMALSSQEVFITSVSHLGLCFARNVHYFVLFYISLCSSWYWHTAEICCCVFCFIQERELNEILSKNTELNVVNSDLQKQLDELGKVRVLLL